MNEPQLPPLCNEGLLHIGDWDSVVSCFFIGGSWPGAEGARRRREECRLDDVTSGVWLTSWVDLRWGAGHDPRQRRFVDLVPHWLGWSRDHAKRSLVLRVPINNISSHIIKNHYNSSISQFASIPHYITLPHVVDGPHRLYWLGNSDGLQLISIQSTIIMKVTTYERILYILAINLTLNY